MTVALVSGHLMSAELLFGGCQSMQTCLSQPGHNECLRGVVICGLSLTSHHACASFVSQGKRSTLGHVCGGGMVVVKPPCCHYGANSE
jgi:hypothetical protein